MKESRLEGRRAQLRRCSGVVERSSIALGEGGGEWSGSRGEEGERMERGRPKKRRRREGELSVVDAVMRAGCR